MNFLIGKRFKFNLNDLSMVVDIAGSFLMSSFFHCCVKQHLNEQSGTRTIHLKYKGRPVGIKKDEPQPME